MLLDEPVEFGRVLVQKKRSEQSVEALHCENIIGQVLEALAQLHSLKIDVDNCAWKFKLKGLLTLTVL